MPSNKLRLPANRRLWLVLPLVLSLWPLTGCKEQIPDSHLEATATMLPDSRVHVQGATTLPDGANILVTFRQPGSKQPITQGLPVVKNHAFETDLGPLNAINVPNGAYEIYVMFSPEAFAWSDQVLPAVGKKGEKLLGPQVRQKDNGIRILENTISFNYVAPSAVPVATNTTTTTTTTSVTAYGVAGPYGVAGAYGYGAPPPGVRPSP